MEIAVNCDFPGNDIGSEIVNDEMQCVRACQATSGCTHFVFNDLNVCWKKRGSVSKENAIWINFSNIFCGIRSNFVKSNLFFHYYSLSSTSNFFIIIPLFYEVVQSRLIDLVCK